MMFVEHLSPERAAEGIAAALANGRSLLNDATLLLANQRWARAASLAILAIEEAGKVPIIRALALASSEDEVKGRWQDYRRHTAKNFLASFLRYAHSSAKLEDLRPLVTDLQAHADIDRMKQLGFYSDISKAGSWSIPAELIEEELSTVLVKTARIVIGEGDSAMTSAAELRIWVKHLRPVWKRDMRVMKEALLACYNEAAATGVLQGSQGPEQLTSFLDLEERSEPM